MMWFRRKRTLIEQNRKLDTKLKVALTRNALYAHKVARQEEEIRRLLAHITEA